MAKTTRDVGILQDRLEADASSAVEIVRELVADEEHNGWVNRETWAVNLWLGSDPLLYEAGLGIARGANGLPGVAADKLKEWMTANVEGVVRDRETTPTDTWINVTREVGSLWRVDWFAVAESLIDELQE